MKLIDKDALVAEIKKICAEEKAIFDEQCRGGYEPSPSPAVVCMKMEHLLSFIDTLEVKEVDLKGEASIRNELAKYLGSYSSRDFAIAKHFFELGLKAQKGEIWKVVDNVNHLQADRNKIYCVFTKQQYILATVINHPQDEDLLQWKCTEFPFHRYDMCEGDKYMQIV